LSQVLQQQYPRIVDVSTSPCGKDTYLKLFLMDETVNQNFWHVPTNSMKKYASSFISRPWVVHPSGDHPQYLKEGVVHNSPTLIDDILDVQSRYKAGDIVDVTYEPLKEDPSRKGWFATVKVTNREIFEKIRSGAMTPYVSPQIYDLSKAEPGQPTTEFIPLHVASVNAPAYGNIARIRASCSGTGSSCINALKSAAQQVINTIDSNSSFGKNLGNNMNILTNPNYIDPNQQQVIANQGYNPYEQQQQQQQQQFISEKKQVQEVDANGNLITRTEDKKPRTQALTQSQQSQPQQQQQQNRPNIIANPEGQQPQQPQQPQQQQAIPVAAAPQVIDPNSTTPQMPAELLEQIKGLQAGLTGITERLNNVENFKKTSEDEKIKAASEAQRQIIEAVFTPEIIQDENARQDIVNYFVGLPLADDDLKKILDMIVTGTFSSGGAQNKQQPAQPPSKKAGAPPGGLKQASAVNNISRLVMTNQVQDNYRGSAPISMAKRFFSDIAVENL
jgi:hypothetical protein